MTTTTVITGYLVSTLGGAVLLWLLIEEFAWNYLAKKGISKKEQGALSVPLGIVERILYTTVFVVNQPSFVAVWLALKVASQWNRWQGNERATYNIFLIGNAFSLISAYLGAWIVLGRLPLMP